MKTAPERVNTKMPTARTFRTITANASKELPTRIEILRAGTWPSDSAKGKLTITVEDLHEMKANFDAGIGMPGGGSVGLPIDFMHEEWDKAAAWIEGLVVEGDALYADPINWTNAGAESVKSGEFKCISPSFWPGCLGEWSDPEDPNVTARNVLVGAGLTNIPFFKDLKPIMADNREQGGDRNVIYIKASESKELNMTLEEIVAKDNAALTEEEKNFLAEHKEELSDEQKTKFGFEVSNEPSEKPENKDDKEEGDEPVSTPVVDKELEPVMASLRTGESVVIKASEHKMLMETAEAYRKEKAEAFVTAHVKRGAIKADQLADWTKKVMADESVKTLLENLPSNEAMQDKQGSDKNSGEISAAAEIQKKATAKVKAAQEKNQTLSIGQAMTEVMAEEPELAEQYRNESKV